MGRGGEGLCPPRAQWEPLGKLDMSPLELREARQMSELGLRSVKAGDCGLQASLQQGGEESALGISCLFRACDCVAHGPDVAPGQWS